MRRRKFLTVAGAATAVLHSGCTSDEDISFTNQEGNESPESDTDDSDELNGLGTENDCRAIAEIFIRGESADVINREIEHSNPVTLTGEEYHTAFFDTEDSRGVQAVVETVEKSDFNVEKTVSGQWCGEPVCNVRSYIEFPQQPSEEAVHDAFPEAVKIGPMTAPGEEAWAVYSAERAQDELINQLDTIGISESSADIYTYNDCILFDSSSN